MASSGRDVRARIAEAADRNAETLEAFFSEALAATRDTSVLCKCGRRVPVEVPDWGARVKVVEAMLNQGFGRPKQEVEEGSRGFTLVRRIVVPSTAPNGGA